MGRHHDALGDINCITQLSAIANGAGGTVTGGAWVPLADYAKTLFVIQRGGGAAITTYNWYVQWSDDGSASSGTVPNSTLDIDSAAGFNSECATIQLDHKLVPVGASHVRIAYDHVGTTEAQTCVAVQMGRRYIATAPQLNPSGLPHPTLDIGENVS
ncbi:MAG TPA: hypothetical protein VM537_22695 [Anaerolineae bacterium]|nr:hypothetical protein [Anaerolineae bacterium]